MAAELGFIHHFVPASGGNPYTLLLLHGTGGNENDLLDLGRSLLPGAALLSPRGNVREGPMPRFFRRLAEGVFDEADLKFRTQELAGFAEASAAAYGFDLQKIIAVGYSNGANIAAGLLLLHPELLKGAVLLRAMVPLEPETPPDLTGVPVLLLSGRSDPIVPVSNVERLAALLHSAGADVTLRWEPGGHQLAEEEIDFARDWLRRVAVESPHGV